MLASGDDERLVLCVARRGVCLCECVCKAAASPWSTQRATVRPLPTCPPARLHPPACRYVLDETSPGTADPAGYHM